MGRPRGAAGLSRPGAGPRGERRGGGDVPSDPGAALAAVPRFDPEVHVSPYELFRRLAEGAAVVVVDVRPEGAAAPQPMGAALEARRCPEGDGLATLVAGAAGEIVLVDDDGAAATRLARAHADGRVRALYGGLELYEHALDPAVVGAGG